jgi:hypothetical protein
MKQGCTRGGKDKEDKDIGGGPRGDGYSLAGQRLNGVRAPLNEFLQLRCWIPIFLAKSPW